MKKLFTTIFLVAFFFPEAYSQSLLSFHGKGNYVELNASDIEPPWTFETWVCRSKSNSYSSLMTSEDEVSGIRLEQWNNTDQVGITKKGVADYKFDYKAPVCEWIHLAIVCDGSSMVLYINGQEEDAIDASIDMPLHTIGAPSAAAGFPSAKVYEMRIWDSALSGTDIEAYKDKSIDPSNPNYSSLVHYYKFDEGKGDTLHDSKGGLHGTINGSSWGSVVSELTSEQRNLSDVLPGSSDNDILKIQFKTLAPDNTPPRAFTFSTKGCTNLSDIAAAKLYYTGCNSSFSTENLVGTIDNPGSTFTITDETELPEEGDNYYWLTYDVVLGPIRNHRLDATFESVVVNGTSTLPVVSEPEGYRLVDYPVVQTIQNLVQNSDFNEKANYWKNGGCTVEADYYETAYGGSDAENRVSEIDAQTCIQQRICVVPGTTYKLTFRATRRTNGAPLSPAVGILITAKGVTSGIQYFGMDSMRFYTNTTWSWKNETLTMTIPAGTADKKIDLRIGPDINNTLQTLGVVIDDVQLNSTPAFSLNGPDSAGCNATNWTIANAPTSGVTYTWAFESGNPETITTTTPSATAQWPDNGTYTVAVTMDNGACGYTFNRIITIEAPVAEAGFSYTKDNLTIHFSGSTKSGVNKWLWNFGDGSAAGTEQNPVHEYLQKGTFTVTLIVWNECSSDTVKVDVKVDGNSGGGNAPVADFTFTVNSLDVAFADASLNNPDSWSWDFGDGNTSQNQNPNHSYDAEGSYDVCLTISNASGGNVICKKVSVGTTGISNPAGDNDIHIYPNPASDNLYISDNLGEEACRMVIYNNLGEKVYQSEQKGSGLIHVDTSSLGNGMYLLHIKGAQNMIQKKFTILR